MSKHEQHKLLRQLRHFAKHAGPELQHYTSGPKGGEHALQILAVLVIALIVVSAVGAIGSRMSR